MTRKTKKDRPWIAAPVQSGASDAGVPPVNHNRLGPVTLNPQVQLDHEALVEFCRKWRIRELSIFGSALRDDFGPESDLDFLVSFEPGTAFDLFDMFDMKEELEARYGRSVDLIEKEALRNPWRKREILKTRKVVYAA